MRQPFTGLEVEAVATRRTEHPRVLEHIKLIYRISGPVDEAAAQKAVKLSYEKYCSVSAMLKKACPIEYSIELVDNTPAEETRK